MLVSQVYSLMNDTVKEIFGETEIVQEDLSNVVDIGKSIIDNDNIDNYVRKLVNHIGKVVFDNKKYTGNVPSVFMDSWEYGSILEKISSDIPEVQENESWNLQNGISYNDDVFHQPSVSAKFYNSKITFEVPMSFTERQVKESFSSSTQLNGFMSMLFNSVENAMTIRIDSLVMKNINNMTAETLEDDILLADYTTSGVKAINLLKLYNVKFDLTLTKNAALTDFEFMRFSTFIINLQKDRMSKISTLFNVGKKRKFTPSKNVTTVLLSDFASSMGVFLHSNILNKDLVKLDNFDTVPYWQGSGTSYDFDSVSKIDVKTASGAEVSVTGILGVMFDKQAVGITNLDRRVTTNYNASAEFYTNYYKFDAGYFNDLDENFIVFFIG
jgi:hypothetical protein